MPQLSFLVLLFPWAYFILLHFGFKFKYRSNTNTLCSVFIGCWQDLIDLNQWLVYIIMLSCTKSCWKKKSNIWYTFVLTLALSGLNFNQEERNWNLCVTAPYISSWGQTQTSCESEIQLWWKCSVLVKDNHWIVALLFFAVFAVNGIRQLPYCSHSAFSH